MSTVSAGPTDRGRYARPSSSIAIFVVAHPVIADADVPTGRNVVRPCRVTEIRHANRENREDFRLERIRRTDDDDAGYKGAVWQCMRGRDLICGSNDRRYLKHDQATGRGHAKELGDVCTRSRAGCAEAQDMSARSRTNWMDARRSGARLRMNWHRARVGRCFRAGEHRPRNVDADGVPERFGSGTVSLPTPQPKSRHVPGLNEARAAASVCRSFWTCARPDAKNSSAFHLPPNLVGSESTPNRGFSPLTLPIFSPASGTCGGPASLDYGCNGSPLRRRGSSACDSLATGCAGILSTRGVGFVVIYPSVSASIGR